MDNTEFATFLKMDENRKQDKQNGKHRIWALRIKMENVNFKTEKIEKQIS